ncbi:MULTISPECIES: sigma-70 family RNA polymerase sigma factor [Streptomycetaceae]|uniref:sigma-70 family RNA polymerase sigma factor n=1 Tax=Streptomycetaceae TaxID=2062 RepID=UPI000938DE53|nr:sigma-70 family RNA polymerase sigma factor [Streptomyces sp. CB02056]OKI03910.1 RNA polymerase subunit sigma-70 [Streptomyces sp. CB02056]
MPDHDRLAEQFERHRPHMRAVAYRMLGSHAESEDAVQETWIRLSRSDADEVANLAGWLTTVIGRICLNILRSRAARPEDPVGVHLPDVVVGQEPSNGPEDEALLSDSVSLALLIVLDTLAPAERVSFVLHDMFHLPFDEIAAVVGKTPAAARKLASRGRRRVQEEREADSGGDFATRRTLVNAFFAAARDGDLDGLVAVLDPDVELRADGGPALAAATASIRGARPVAGRASLFRQGGVAVFPVLVNGVPGALVTRDGAPTSVMGFSVRGGRITRIQILLDPERVGAVDFAAFTA